MLVQSLFAQLQEAYFLIDKATGSPVFINASACELLHTNASGFIHSAQWADQLGPIVAQCHDQTNALCYCNSQHLQLNFSHLEWESQALLAVHVTRPIPSEETLHNFFNIVDNLGAYVYCKERDLSYSYANKQVCELFELPQEEVIGKNDRELFGEETGQTLQSTDRQVIQSGMPVETEEINFVPQLNSYRHYLTVKKPLYDERGECTGLFGISTDITEQKRIQQQLHDSERKLSTILDNVGAYIFIKDKDCRFRYINRMTEALFQRNSDEIVGMNNFDLLGPEQGEEFDRTDRQVFATGEQVTCIETFIAPDTVLYYWTVKIPMRNEHGEIDCYIGISTDITEQKRLENQAREYNEQLQQTIAEINHLKDELQQQATHDALTGLYNRRFLEEHAALSFTDPRRAPTSLLMIDVDHFKQVNDQMGHKVGDEFLQLLAQVMTGECRSNDLVCRYGGEEFLILLPNTPLETSFQKAEWIRKQYERQVAQAFPDAPSNSISIGVATSPLHGHDFEALYQAADKALYFAKQQGRNRTILAREDTRT